MFVDLIFFASGWLISLLLSFTFFSKKIFLLALHTPSGAVAVVLFLCLMFLVQVAIPMALRNPIYFGSLGLVIKVCVLILLILLVMIVVNGWGYVPLLSEGWAGVKVFVALLYSAWLGLTGFFDKSKWSLNNVVDQAAQATAETSKKVTKKIVAKSLEKKKAKNSFTDAFFSPFKKAFKGDDGIGQLTGGGSSKKFPSVFF